MNFKMDISESKVVVDKYNKRMFISLNQITAMKSPANEQR